MSSPFYECDDLHDAAKAAVRALDDRLNRRGLQLVPEAWEPLQQVLTGALALVEVEAMDGI